MKKITFLTLIFLTFINVNTFAQNEISGTVTYFFNKYQGDKVDIGAKVYLVDSITYSNIKGIQYLKNFGHMEVKRSILSYYNDDLIRLNNNSDYNKTLKRKIKLEKRNNHLKEKNKKEYNNILSHIKSQEEKIKEKKKSIKTYADELKKANAYENEDWESHLSNASTAFNHIMYFSKKKIKTVNGTGAYSFKNVLNGKYYIIIQSNNRTSINMIEILGKVYLKQITIKGQDLDVSHNFGI